jgi:hypothetical protein
MLDREQPVTLEHSLVHPEGPVIAAEHLSDRTAPAHGRPQVYPFRRGLWKTPSVVVSDRQ